MTDNSLKGWSKSRALRYIQTQKRIICFYSGLDLTEQSAELWSLEHIIPRYLFKHHNQYTIFNMPFNIAPCLDGINPLIGAAPLRVKFGLKKFLSEQIIPHWMPLAKKIETYEYLTKVYLTRYRVHNRFPWQEHFTWKHGISKEEKRRQLDDMQSALQELLTDEEKQFLKHFKNKPSVSQVVEKVAKKK